MQLQVTAIEQQAVGVKSFELRALDREALPSFEAGARVCIEIPGLPGDDARRAYSLVSDPNDLKRYEIAVLELEAGGVGASYLHCEVRVGDMLEVSLPRNDFAIDDSAGHSLLIAGGIGITPILSLTRELARRASSFEVHYVGRGAETMAYRETICQMAPGRVKLYVSRGQFDLAETLQASVPGTHIYVCGPHSLIEATRRAALVAGFARQRVHFEAFGYRQMPGDRPVDVELRNSGMTIRVAPGRPLLAAIESAGIWVPADCRRGECGTCVASVVEGEAEHRDHCLTPVDRLTSICTCVSWATSDRLILDL